MTCYSNYLRETGYALRKIGVGWRNLSAPKRTPSRASWIPHGTACPFYFSSENRISLYLFGLAADFAAAACFFCLAAAACDAFCVFCFCTDFGDLSPIIGLPFIVRLTVLRHG